MEGFRAEYEKELANIAADGRAEMPIAVEESERPDAVLRLGRARNEASAEPGFQQFYSTNCYKQKQAGHYAVVARLDRGDITSRQLRGVARLARDFGDGEVRLTNEQNLILRWVPEGSLTALHAELLALGLARAGARTIHDVTSCPGADTCNLAVTKSRELATVVQEALEGAGALVEGAEKLDIKISGCPNSCGQHHVASLGFHGAMRRVGGQAVPEYELHLGGGIDGNGATFGRRLVKVPARRVPQTVVRLLELWKREKKEGESALTFFRRVDPQVVKAAVADLSAIDEKTASPEDYLDNGDDQPFKVAIGEGECAA